MDGLGPSEPRGRSILPLALAGALALLAPLTALAAGLGAPQAVALGGCGVALALAVALLALLARPPAPATCSGPGSRRHQQAQRLESLGELVGGIAHDFNNLLAIISSYAEFLEEELAERPEARADAAEIRLAAERGARLTRQLLTFSRRGALKRELVDVNEVAGETARLLSRTLGERVVVEPRCATRPTTVLADRGHLEQVVVNLGLNARDAMPAGGTVVIETKEVTLAGQAAQRVGLASGGYVRLRVSDTGVGMDEETLSRVYEPFFTTKDKANGTGLGLSTVHGIVKQAGGEIDIRSELGRGTTVTIHLPRAAGPAVSAPAASTTFDEPSAAARILLVEDEDGVRSVACRTLRAEGYDVVGAADGIEALRLSHELKLEIDLLLTDVVMPNLTGPEVANRLVERHPLMRVLFMSGYADDALERHGLPARDRSLLAKPFTAEALRAAVHHALRSQPAGTGRGDENDVLGQAA